MTTILSPTEQLGLAGAALDSRIRRAAGHVSDLAFSRAAQRLSADAHAHEVVYERDGEYVGIPIMLRPLLAMPEQISYVHHVCLQLMDALKRLPDLYLNDPAVRTALAITEAEDGFLRETWTEAHRRANPVYGRLDAVCDYAAAAWQDSLHFMEANLSGVGGISYGPLAEQLVMRDIVPTLRAHDPALEIELPRDQRDLFVQMLIDHARAIGRNACRLCFIEPKYAEDGINEQSVLSRFLAERHGLTIAHADPAELRVEDGEVYYGDVCIDVGYRDYEARDIIELEAELGRKLDAMRLLFRQNRMISTPVGDFDHKSAFEVLTDPAIAERIFSADECRLFRRHVLWTRVVRERKTTLPHNAEGDLLEFMRNNREILVMKPNRAYGGEGVLIGAHTSAADWERQIDEAVAASGDPDLTFVVQRATSLPVAEFPVLAPDGRVHAEPFYAVMGYAPTENGLSTMCRVSQKHVVNVAQNGGLAAVLTAYQPEALTLPRRSRARSDGAGEALRAQIADLIHADHAIAALEFDAETGMPQGAAPERGAQLATLEAGRHRLLISDELGDLIAEANAQWAGEPDRMRELQLLRELREAEMALPEDLVRRFAEAKACSYAAWEEAREAGDYKILAPALDATLQAARELSAAADPGGDPYDALMEEYEPGMTRARLEPVLSEVRQRLVPLMRQAARRADEGDALKGRDVPADGLTAVCRDLLIAIGFDFSRGGLATSTHPGTTQLGFDDLRLTLREGETRLLPGLLTALHEGGHALYDQGYAKSDRGTLLAAAPSMGLHEAQARLWENHVGRSQGFWRFVTPKLAAAFPAQMQGFDPARLYKAANRIRPSVNRASADELTYHLHIILRTELEIELVSGRLRTADLSAAWKDRSLALLGLAPRDDDEGVLQDGHWAAGMFGYFPTYTIGSLYAAQLAEAYAKSAPLDDELSAGTFSGLLGFLRRAVHQKGDRMTADETVRQATGEGLSAAAFFRHIERKLSV